MIIKKKVLFCVLFLYLSTLAASVYLRGEEISTPNLLIEQENLLLKAQTSIEKTKKSNINLENQLSLSLKRTENLEKQLENLENQLLESNHQLLQANQSVKTLEQNSTQLTNSLEEASKSIEQSKKDFQHLQMENNIIKIVGGSAIAILAGLLIYGELSK